jgi:hypothetical protein
MLKGCSALNIVHSLRVMSITLFLGLNLYRPCAPHLQQDNTSETFWQYRFYAPLIFSFLVPPIISLTVDDLLIKLASQE